MRSSSLQRTSATRSNAVTPAALRSLAVHPAPRNSEMGYDGATSTSWAEVNPACLTISVALKSASRSCWAPKPVCEGWGEGGEEVGRCGRWEVLWRCER